MDVIELSSIENEISFKTLVPAYDLFNFSTKRCSLGISINFLMLFPYKV
jgi:hypothetical protein